MYAFTPARSDTVAEAGLTLMPSVSRYSICAEWVASFGTAFDDPDLVRPDAEIAAGRHIGVLLTNRPGGGVARIGEHPEPRLGLAAIEFLEGGKGHVDLAPDLENLGGSTEEPQRDRLDGPEVGGDVLAGRPVPPGGGAGEEAVFVGHDHGQPVDLELTGVARRRPAEHPDHPLFPGIEFGGSFDVVE